jgi:hypothetical protein
MIFAAIVASARVRAGKTLLARLLAENFLLSGSRPALFDTESSERRLWSYFPNETTVVDLDRVTDQMTLFEALTVGSEHPRIVEVTHRSSKKFFDVMRDSDYVSEARASGIEPVVFYIPSPDPDSFEYGRQLREHLGHCSFVVVNNAHLGEIKHFTRLSVGYRALETNRPRLLIPRLDPAYTGAIDDPTLSFSEFIRDPRTDLPLAARDAIRQWLVRSLREIYGVMRALEDAGGAYASERDGPF